MKQVFVSCLFLFIKLFHFSSFNPTRNIQPRRQPKFPNPNNNNNNNNNNRYCQTFFLQENQLSSVIILHVESKKECTEEEDEEKNETNIKKKAYTTGGYDLGVGKNPPVVPSYRYTKKDDDASESRSESKPKSRSNTSNTTIVNDTENNNDNKHIHWNVPAHPYSKKIDNNIIDNRTKIIDDTVSASSSKKRTYSIDGTAPTADTPSSKNEVQPRRVRRMVARTEEMNSLRGAIWDEGHYSSSDDEQIKGNTNKSLSLPSEAAEGGEVERIMTTKPSSTLVVPAQNTTITDTSTTEENEKNNVGSIIGRPSMFYPDIDLSIPLTVYDPEKSRDVVWDLMRWDAYQEAQKEPLLVSFLYSSILNHDSLESSLAFLLANKLSSAAMISTQIQSLILNAMKKDPTISRSIRADIMAVRDRDPACLSLPDVFLYFKGFHALQTYRVAHSIWKTDNKQVLAHYLQSQMSQTFQIDIHPNATLGSGIMLDHGTGIVIGETAHVGHNCSILHHVTLGGSGKKGVDRHPKVGNGVLLGAGTSVLGNVKIGEGCQVGAGGLVITDLPEHSVAVGVPVKIIGNFVDVTEQPSISMNQTFLSEGI